MWSRRVICRNVFQRLYSSGKQSKGEKTALYDFHVEKGGKIVNFGGFLLPVQYSDLSITASHVHTRTKASIFDVSHMLQTEVKGNGCLDYLESICTADLKNLQNNSSVLTIFTNEKGGIYDDLIITKIANDHLYIVSNAAMKEQDQQILTTALQNYKTRKSNDNIDLKFFSPLEKGLLALQGPKAAENLQKLTEVDLKKLYFMTSAIGRVGNVENCRITRCGYTGEDGFEISMPAENQREVVETLLQDENVKMAGLGARDTLRLEAGLCLYGSDMDQSTTPVEAALTWLVSKSRREKKNFPGAQIILDQIKNGCLKKRVGIMSEAGPPARYGTKIVNENNEQIGDITSGCPAPTLGKNISMGYIQTENSKIGSKILLRIRDKLYNGVVTKMPFVVSHYYNKPKTTG